MDEPNIAVNPPVADAVPTPAKPAAPPRPTRTVAAKHEEEKTQPNKMRRRLIWTAVWAYLAANFLMFLRFFFPRALFEPSTVHTIGYPTDFSLGVDERFKQSDRIWVVKEPDRLFVIFARCTHLGCTPDWKPAENKFKCPCHGSGYTPEGINFEGPAPRPMDRAHVELDPTGRIVTDTSRLYMWDRSKGGRDQFNDPGAFIPV
ncbi:MAG TPA: Rieske 2Fe-2S domain-containing protein [Terriglobia bacterium]|nr:Rieske 2Fe-2S domain-containing protein [Terriglobia bacterium]